MVSKMLPGTIRPAKEAEQILRKSYADTLRAPSRRREDVVAEGASLLVLRALRLAELACVTVGVPEPAIDLRMRAYAVDPEELSFDSIAGVFVAIDLIQ